MNIIVIKEKVVNNSEVETRFAGKNLTSIGGVFGTVDILVNNADIYPRIPLAQMSIDNLERVISVNLKGTFLCSHEVSLRMITYSTLQIKLSTASGYEILQSFPSNLFASAIASSTLAKGSKPSILATSKSVAPARKAFPRCLRP